MARAETRRAAPLVGILLVGFTPLLLAWLMTTQSWGVPERTLNRGRLLPPGQQLSRWDLVNPDGSAWDAVGRWRLLLLTGGPCDSACRVWVERLDAIRRATGRDRQRLTFRLVDDTPQPLPRVHSRSPARLPAPPGVYLADPRGNLVLRYDLDTPPRAILLDLRRLLRASQIG